MSAPPNVLRPTVEEARAAWARLVDADAEQVARLREPAPDGDRYAPIAARFAPGQLAATEVAVLGQIAQPNDTWLDSAPAADGSRCGSHGACAGWSRSNRPRRCATC